MQCAKFRSCLTLCSSSHPVLLLLCTTQNTMATHNTTPLTVNNTHTITTTTTSIILAQLTVYTRLNKTRAPSLFCFQFASLNSSHPVSHLFTKRQTPASPSIRSTFAAAVMLVFCLLESLNFDTGIVLMVAKKCSGVPNSMHAL